MTGHREDVMAILDASDVVVAPSRIDAFPTVLLEAMAAGVPTVATAVGGIPEIVVDGETGLLVSPTAAAAGLAAALREVLDNEDLRGRLGNAARDRYEDEFTAAKWARRTASLYRRVLASRDDDGRVVRG
jgi:glycosyltransferase involved in cell wall biosynthesis